METKFNEFKNEIFRRLNAIGAKRGDEFDNSKTFTSLMDAIKGDFWFLCRHDILTEDLFKAYGQEFADANIHYNENTTSGYLLVVDDWADAYGSTKVVAKKRSHVTARDNSEVFAFDNTSINAKDNSKVIADDQTIVRAWAVDSVKAMGHSEVYADGHTRVWAFDEATVEAKGYVNLLLRGKAKAKVYDSVTVNAMDNTYVIGHNDSYITIRDAAKYELFNNAIVRDVNNKKIVYKKNELKIEAKN